MNVRGGGTLLLTAVFLWNACSLTDAAHDARALSPLHSQAIDLYRAKRYLEAVPIYRQLAKEMPDNPDVLMDLLWTLWFAEHYAEVASVATRLAAIRAEDATVWTLLGRSHYLLGHYEKALPALQKSLSLDPEQPTLMLDTARVHMKLRDYRSALDVLRQLREKHSELTQALPDLAKVLFLQGQFLESAKIWAQAGGAFPDNPEYKFQEAQALYFGGRRARALAQMKAILVRTPHHRSTLNFLVDTALAQGDTAEAEKILAPELSISTPADEPLFVRLATIYQVRKDYEGCVRTTERILDANPRHGEALMMQADCFRDQGNLGDAKERYDRILQNNPWSLRAWKALAELHFRLGRPDAALPYIRQARSLDPTDPYMIFLESNYLYAKGEKAQSEAILTQWLASQRGPSLPVLLYHGLTPFQGDPLLAYSIHTPVAVFDDQMREVMMAGFHPITAEQAQAWFEGKFQLPPRSILITFDDARLDSFRYGDPILKKYSLRSTMFVALANVQRNLPGFASWPQLRSYQRSGRWEMQAHGNEGHGKIPTGEEGYGGLFMPNKLWLDKEKRLETTPEWEARIVRDMKETNQALRSQLGKMPKVFAFPEGDFGQDNIPNFPEAPPLVLEHSRKLYGSLYHQDAYGFNPPSRDPSFLCRIEVSHRWKGRDLVRHLTDKDPIVMAKRALLRRATWERKTREAWAWLDQIKKDGASPAVLLADEARIRMSVGDRPRAWDLAVRALTLDPENQDTMHLVKSLEAEKRIGWTPSFEYFEDNKDRENWFFNQRLETLRTGNFRWELSQFHGFFSEKGVPHVTDDGGGVGLSHPLGLYHHWAVKADGHIFSGAAQNDFSLDGRFRSRWVDHLETSVSVGRAPFPTASALNAHVTERHVDLKAEWSSGGAWKAVADGRVFDFSDHNQRYGGSLEISRKLCPESGWRAAYRFTAGNTDHVSPNYYSPQELQLHQLGLNYEATLARAFRLSLGYLPGYGDEVGARDNFVQVAHADLRVNWGTAFSLQPGFAFTNTPTYRRYSYSLALNFLF